MDRREFVSGFVFSTAAITLPKTRVKNASVAALNEPKTAKNDQFCDFRFAPHRWQSLICFPDDPKKTVIGKMGDLRYDFPQGPQLGVGDFRTVFEFSLSGFQDDRWERQWVEAPGVPIVHTLIDRPAAQFELVAFASRNAKEGRVDNVLMTVHPKKGTVAVAPKIHIQTCDKLSLADGNSPVATVLNAEKKVALLGAQVGDQRGICVWWEEQGYTLYPPHGEAGEEKPARYFFRLPQEGQDAEAIRERLQDPETVLEETRAFWKEWKAYGSTAWSCPGRHGEFVTACARNIQQAREVRDGRLVFEVGPTWYRGLWIVDGNFLLEAARYLGYDKEADEGLKSEWNKQLPTGQVSASAGGEHWKDTAIAMYTLVRQCELKQDWSLFRELEPNVRRAIDFLVGLRDEAKKGSSSNGKYGLLAPGFADGGIGGVRPEFTNTVWTLAGLKAVARTAAALKMDSLAVASNFYNELYAAFQAMAKREMVLHPAGFEYLPMLAHDDPSLRDPDPWSRPRPQTAQWALSHAIYPGTVFAKDDPIVRGHIALMQWCTREDIPAETGWLWHDALWTYNASFAAHVYLWAGVKDWAHRTFTGFLNHASPLYCWREEQPLQNALVGQDWGDMPHNWASAECVRYLRHMLALEDGDELRLLQGITPAELTAQTNYTIEHSPTRFGRISLSLQADGKRRWRVKYRREGGPEPKAVRVPERIGALTVKVGDTSQREWEGWVE